MVAHRMNSAESTVFSHCRDCLEGVGMEKGKAQEHIRWEVVLAGRQELDVGGTSTGAMMCNETLALARMSG